MSVSRKSVLTKMKECDAIGVEAFLKKYGFQRPRGVILRYHGREYPARAIWGAAHIPKLNPTYDNARMYHGQSAFHNLDRAFYVTTSAEYLELEAHNDSIEDLTDDGIGNDDPEYRKRIVGTYIRNSRVRQKVLERANGRCEYGGCKPFTNLHGVVYLETHHVISLAVQGRDKLENVIALCPNHHREAHFGNNWLKLQGEFLRILSNRR